MAAEPVAPSPSPIVVSRSRMVEGAPSSMYWALGLGNQLIQVDPASQTVVVRLGSGTPLPVAPTFGPGEASRVVTQALGGR